MKTSARGGVTVGAQAHWYPTATSRRLVRRDDAEWVLEGTVHARRCGELTTACGLLAVDWPMSFYEPFAAARGDVCRSCVRTVVGV
ncbi:hypothetical protein [Aeromicrobium yanjiei]|uniref:Uncharacterized protein n=1 Tax=Aeromicrobium yanjiei TaxID=2662028 RepID=A0A5Q2MJV5_9ACTN|nr:hypothetical protein [Aeromicrobium yanjiei]QGG40585.1 hypothetical protein GEV26_03955 [Aeromicrobium yanjiei]